MLENRPAPAQRRFGHILPWLWVVGPAYLVAMLIAMLAETRATDGSAVLDFFSSFN